MDDRYAGLKLENQLCFPLYAASRAVIKQYTPHLKPLGLTYTQYITMMVLWDKKCVSVGELCETLFLDSGTLTPLLKKMETEDYITRERSREDERVVMVRITEKGEELKDKAVEIPSKVGNCITLSKEDAKSLYRMLYELIEGTR